jgi:hypothetical protein
MVMNTLVQHNKQIQVLEEKFSMLRNMVWNLNKGSKEVAFNYNMPANTTQEYLKEEYIMHQMQEEMDLGNHDSHHTNCWDIKH